MTPTFRHIRCGSAYSLLQQTYCDCCWRHKTQGHVTESIQSHDFYFYALSQYRAQWTQWQSIDSSRQVNAWVCNTLPKLAEQKQHIAARNCYHLNTCTHTYMHTHTCTHMHAHTCTHTHTHTHAHTHTHTHTHTDIYSLVQCPLRSSISSLAPDTSSNCLTARSTHHCFVTLTLNSLSEVFQNVPLLMWPEVKETISTGLSVLTN